ncbi:hypothetical protein CGGC5_v012064 [Colletotrichum fructicola Nara gc5]|uniref:Uncharacterized protein n=1 Tax=Colletotrichum fructicola (strain Nara gc5) TaxID=1213859 RepID=A0A7J6IQ26_COLFN|nr:hypothetical protein CGGC5_v012064 [Colletotrichum fructicola Nara gc5]
MSEGIGRPVKDVASIRCSGRIQPLCSATVAYAILETIMPSRRGHSNSHHGCTQCKTGRVKCDEVRAGSLSSAEGERQDTSKTEIGGIHRSLPRFGATGLPSSDLTEQLLLHHYFGHLAFLSFGSVDKWDIVPAFRQAVTRHVLTEAIEV